MTRPGAAPDDATYDLRARAFMPELHRGRTQAVPGEGSPSTEVVFIGEGPGLNEDRQGRPFVGQAGSLLSELIGSIGWRREEVFITNIVKCRPPGNRDPEPAEIAACAPFQRDAPAGSTADAGLALLQAAESRIGAPYRYGGAGPDAFDCSGLVAYVHQQVGISVPRTAAQQFAVATPVTRRDLRPGDLCSSDSRAGRSDTSVSTRVTSGVCLP